jgi:hypothetical protein
LTANRTQASENPRNHGLSEAQASSRGRTRYPGRTPLPPAEAFGVTYHRTATSGNPLPGARSGKRGRFPLRREGSRPNRLRNVGAPRGSRPDSTRPVPAARTRCGRSSSLRRPCSGPSSCPGSEAGWTPRAGSTTWSRSPLGASGAGSAGAVRRRRARSGRGSGPSPPVRSPRCCERKGG